MWPNHLQEFGSRWWMFRLIHIPSGRENTWKVYCNLINALKLIIPISQLMLWGTRNLLNDSIHRNYMNLALGHPEIWSFNSLDSCPSFNVGFHCCMIGALLASWQHHILPHVFLLCPCISAFFINFNPMKKTSLQQVTTNSWWKNASNVETTSPKVNWKPQRGLATTLQLCTCACFTSTWSAWSHTIVDVRPEG